MKKIAVGDLGEFWYGDYKEPFVQLEGAIPGYPQGVLLKADDGKLLCPWCGKTCESLGSHARKHGMTGPQAKEEMGLLTGSALVSERVRLDKVRQGLRSSWRRLPPRPDGAGHYPQPLRGLGKNKPESQNKTGRCYAQLLAIGQSLMRERGRVSMPGLRSIGVSRDVILARFGSLERFQRLVGDARDTSKYSVRWDRPRLLEGLQNLAQELGRTPSVSDLARVGLPCTTTYQRHFGTYSAACVAAGLSPLRYVPDTGSDAAILLAYASVGSIGRTGMLMHRGEGTVRDCLLRYGIPIPLAGPPGSANRYSRDMASEMAARLAGVETAA